ncbi:unnamed protein product [Diamesa hyperborea]
MLRRFTKGAPALLALSLPMEWYNHDKISKENKTAKEFYLRKNDTETGKDRMYRMFTMDEFGRMSSELNAIYQAGFLGMFAGAVYGGFLGSRSAYFDFMDRNQATAFKSHLDAKKKLQDNVTTNFAKGAFKFGWRLGLFSISYVGITTMVSVYRGESSIWEYLAAGMLTGSMYKFNMGLRGIAAGGLVGGFLGTIAGGVSLLVLKTTGMSMEEVRYWQYKWRADRDDTINEAMKAQTMDERDQLMDWKDSRVGVDKLSLETLVKAEESPKVVPEVKK